MLLSSYFFITLLIVYVMVVRIEESVYKIVSDSNVYLIMKHEVMVIDT